MDGNDRYVETTEVRMVPALLHAYSLARGTAMACRQPELEAEFEARISALCGQVGIPSLHRHVDDGAFYRACTAMADAREWFWFTRADRPWSGPAKAGHVILVVDGDPFDIGRDLASDCPVLGAIQDLVGRCCHVEATRLPDVDDWREYDPRRHPDEARALVAASLGP